MTEFSHDLSWGTKGADTTDATDLGAVQGIGNQVEVELVSAQQDIDSAYQDALDNIRLKRAKVDSDELPPKKEMSEQQQKDVYVSRQRSWMIKAECEANFRTNVWTRSKRELMLSCCSYGHFPTLS